jgi:hypothetical protein
MARVPVEHLSPGVRLHQPVFNVHGLLLLKAGEPLSAKHLELLRVWGVREVEVLAESGENPAEPADAQAPPEVLEAAEREAGRRFRRVDTVGDPVLRELRRIAVSRLLRQAGRSGQTISLTKH